MITKVAAQLQARGAALSLLGLLSISLGCQHAEHKTADTHRTPTYEAALNDAFREAEAPIAYRMPAQATGTGIDLQALNQVRPGKFKVFVYPKLTSISNKTSEDAKPLYKDASEERASHLGRPLEYEVSTIAENPCAQFIEKNLFANTGAKEMFDASLAQDKNRRCAIIEITSLKMKAANRALIKRDDQLRVRLFLDDTYGLHGYDLEKYVDGQNTRVVRVKGDGLQAAASGLTLFPMDIPTLEILSRTNAAKRELTVTSRIDKLSISQAKKIDGGFKPVTCQGTETRYTDFYGSKVEVGWCNNTPFPQYMENNRFVAVTQPLSVR